MELGRSWRTLLMMMLLLRPRGAGELRGHRQQAALKDQRFRPPALTRSRRIFARARARARRWRRELGGGVRQHPGSNNCVEGAPR